MKQETFNSLLKNNKFIIIDCFTNWCGPCGIMKPIFKNVSEKYKDKAIFLLLDADLDENSWFVNKYFVMSIPHIMFFCNEKLVYEHSGIIEQPKFEYLIDSLIYNEKIEQINEIANKLHFDSVLEKFEYIVLLIYNNEGKLYKKIISILEKVANKYRDILFVKSNINAHPFLKDILNNDTYNSLINSTNDAFQILLYKSKNLSMQFNIDNIDMVDNVSSWIYNNYPNEFKTKVYLNGITEDEFNNIIKNNKFVFMNIYTGKKKIKKYKIDSYALNYTDILFCLIKFNNMDWLQKYIENIKCPIFLFYKNSNLFYSYMGGIIKENLLLDYIEKIKNDNYNI